MKTLLDKTLLDLRRFASKQLDAKNDSFWYEARGKLDFLIGQYGPDTEIWSTLESCRQEMSSFEGKQSPLSKSQYAFYRQCQETISSILNLTK